MSSEKDRRLVVAAFTKRAVAETPLVTAPTVPGKPNPPAVAGKKPIGKGKPISSKPITTKFSSELAEQIVGHLDKVAKGELPCPGSKIRSKGMGRGLGLGKGKGPIGVPVKAKGENSNGDPDIEKLPNEKMKEKAKQVKKKVPEPGFPKATAIINEAIEKAAEPKGQKVEAGSRKGGKSEPASGAAPGEGGRFSAMKSKLSKQKGVRDPGALAAAIGRSKYGKGKFQHMASKGSAVYDMLGSALMKNAVGLGGALGGAGGALAGIGVGDLIANQALPWNAFNFNAAHARKRQLVRLVSTLLGAAGGGYLGSRFGAKKEEKKKKKEGEEKKSSLSAILDKASQAGGLGGALSKSAVTTEEIGQLFSGDGSRAESDLRQAKLRNILAAILGGAGVIGAGYLGYKGIRGLGNLAYRGAEGLGQAIGRKIGVPQKEEEEEEKEEEGEEKESSLSAILDKASQEEIAEMKPLAADQPVKKAPMKKAEPKKSENAVEKKAQVPTLPTPPPSASGDAKSTAGGPSGLDKILSQLGGGLETIGSKSMSGVGSLLGGLGLPGAQEKMRMWSEDPTVSRGVGGGVSALGAVLLAYLLRRLLAGQGGGGEYGMVQSAGLRCQDMLKTAQVNPLGIPVARKAGERAAEYLRSRMPSGKWEPLMMPVARSAAKYLRPNMPSREKVGPDVQKAIQLAQQRMAKLPGYASPQAKRVGEGALAIGAKLNLPGVSQWDREKAKEMLSVGPKETIPHPGSPAFIDVPSFMGGSGGTSNVVPPARR